MDFSNLADETAALAHRCWCKRMLNEGWRPGRVTDPLLKTHEVLRPYAELPPELREEFRQMVTAQELGPALAAMAGRALDRRDLLARDVYVGMAVRPVGGNPARTGKIVSWSASRSEPDLLGEIKVEWSDGRVMGHHPGGLEPAGD